jgi:hypothetical protein
MKINIGSITRFMIADARQAAAGRWPAIRALAEPELRKLAKTLEDVRKLQASGAIDASRASALVAMQRDNAVKVLRSIEGIGVLTARAAVDAAAHAAGSVVNGIFGFDLIPVPGPAVKANFKAGKDL